MVCWTSIVLCSAKKKTEKKRESLKKGFIFKWIMFYLRKCIEKKPLLAMLLNILTWPRKNEFQEATNSIGYGEIRAHVLPKWSWDPLGSCISHIYQNLDYKQAQQEPTCY